MGTLLTSSNLALMIAAGVGVLAILVMSTESWLGQRDRLRRRIATAARFGPRVSASEQTALLLVRELRQGVHRIAVNLGGTPLLSAGDRDRMQGLLVRAGWRQREAVGTYGTVKMLCSAAGLAIGILLVVGLGVQAGEPVFQLLVVLVAVFFGGMLPEIAVKRVAAWRQTQIRLNLADAIDLMIIAANAGQSLDVSLARVAEEMERQAPALGDELQVTMSELRGLSDRRQPLENLARRTELKEVRSVCATLIQTLRYGTPLAQSLKTLAREMREARMLAIEEKAARLPALISLPLMLFIMPAIFIVTAGPAVLALGEAFGP